MGGVGSGRRKATVIQPDQLVQRTVDPPRLPEQQWHSWVCRCGEPGRMTIESYKVFKRTHQTFYCVHGHPSAYPEGESEVDKLRRERDRLAQQIAQKDDQLREEREAAFRQIAAHKGQITRLKNRAKAGVCPCCNRSFENLRRHMATKHPTFTPIELEVIEGGKADAA